MLIEKFKNNLKNKVEDQELANDNDEEGPRKVELPKMGISKLMKMVEDKKKEIVLENCTHSHSPVKSLPITPPAIN
jgi:hypothetical protein